MTFTSRLLWQLCSLALLLLSLDSRTSVLVCAEEQVVLVDPGLDQTLNHIRYSSNVESDSARHVAEKSRLLKTLERNDEDWNGDHPRYRLLQAMHGYIRYQERYTDQLEGWEKSYENLPDAQKKVLESSTNYGRVFAKAKDMWAINGRLAEDIVAAGMKYYQITSEELDGFITENENDEIWDNQPAITDAINHYVRDWSSDGLHERIPTFDPILETIDENFPDRAERKEGPIKVLIPGSGMGRLPHDVALLGNMEVTSNEYSYYMNLAYRYIETLNIPKSVPFHPYLDWWSYQPTPEERQAEVTIPDVPVNASNVLMVEGDFMHVFDHETAHYDVVVTLFFIDTAKNSLDYIDNINRLLKPGGLWINLGPLLYGTNPTVQLSLKEMINVSETMGFEFLDTDEKWGTITLPGKKVRSNDINYLVNARSIRRNVYVTQFWAAKKVHRNYDAFPKGTEKSSTPEHTFNS